MKEQKKSKIRVIILLLAIIAVGCYFVYHHIENINTTPEKKPIEVLETIKEYDYHLEDRDSEIYKENFFELKDLLEKSQTIDYKKYAEYLATLFIIDLYTIDNKVSKYDVGSLDFIYPEEKEKFKNKVMDSLYKMVVDNSENTRKQELPKVKKVQIEKLETTKYEKKDKTLDGYLLQMTIFYQKDLGYDKDVTLTIAKEENKLYVVNLTIPQN